MQLRHQDDGRVRSWTDAMAQALLPEDRWSLIATHLPNHCRSPKGGRPRINDRAALTGMLFVLRTGLPSEYLPRELGCGSSMTCWHRLHDCMQAGVWQRVHEALLRRLREHNQILWIERALTLLACPRLSEVRPEVLPGVLGSCRMGLAGRAGSPSTAPGSRTPGTQPGCIAVRPIVPASTAGSIPRFHSG